MNFPTDLGDLFKKAQEMQSEMARIKKDLANKIVEGSSGGGMVTVKVNGNGRLVAVHIDPVTTTDLAMLQDLVVAASNNALEKMQKEVGDAMSQVTGGLPIPGFEP